MGSEMCIRDRHNTLALHVAGLDRDQVPTVTVLGLAGQHCWRRPKVALKPKQKAKAGRLARTRESARWMACLEAWPQAPAGGPVDLCRGSGIGHL